jgi:hypothetical protein
MQGKMCWLSVSGGDGEKILHLQMNPHEPWRPYTAFPMFAAPDHAMPGGSKGLATYQKLSKAGWTLIPTAQGRSY